MKFMYIYIEEAHAVDEWPIGDEYRKDVVAQSQTKTLMERIERAKWTRNQLNLTQPLFVENPVSPVDEVCFSRLYSPWPIRWYLVAHGVLFHYGSTQDAYPDIHVLKDLLQHMG